MDRFDSVTAPFKYRPLLNFEYPPLLKNRWKIQQWPCVINLEKYERNRSLSPCSFFGSTILFFGRQLVSIVDCQFLSICQLFCQLFCQQGPTRKHVEEFLSVPNKMHFSDRQFSFSGGNKLSTRTDRKMSFSGRIRSRVLDNLQTVASLLPHYKTKTFPP